MGPILLLINKNRTPLGFSMTGAFDDQNLMTAKVPGA